MTTQLTDKYFTLEATIGLEELAEQLSQETIFSGLTDDDLLEFLTMVISNRNSEYLDYKMLGVMQDFVAQWASKTDLF